MTLTKVHREALLNELEKAEKKVELSNLVLSKNKDDGMNEWFEIGVFLSLQNLEIIKKSLIDNEIDF